MAALLADPGFYLGLTLPDLSRPEIVEASDDGEEVLLRLRYEFTGSLDSIAQRLLGSHRLKWIQELRLERSAGSGSLHFAVEIDPRRLHGDAGFVLTGTGSETVRVIDGELVVAVPGLGRMAERRIVPGVLRRLDIEAQALQAHLLE